MFDLSVVKSKTGKRSLPPLPPDEFNIFDCPLPYYSTIPQLRWKDHRFQRLSRHERGDFSLLTDFMWQGCGAIRWEQITDIAAAMEAPVSEIEKLVRRLLEFGLLVEHQGRLVQPELRNQYRETLSANMNKKRGKSQAEDDKGGNW